ncbi:MAG: hypothetical protein UX91_C0007G0188 [Candidatus Amesbacteria bacterium GW2011_GWB1_47_19]|nr:MAG: hypothetical protein UW51_C0006G0002 [Candidatus Amesbacteria bacterium GW2011_GWA1_44_24]KKU31965.1 MAG: AprM [Candidatus Amesbacteria bacterium GW2011_GWC1_46_24]KKU66901.1 MAG: hypothetical protein UX91_C0007G0188 [Candidatus Amesbacteria bacterium GW2011_GWB1_47_19]
MPDRTGTEEYSWQIIKHILALPEARKHEWILYVKPNFQFSIFNFQSIPNVQILKIQIPYLWTQVGLVWRTWVDRLDVLWIPAHTLPVLRKPGIKTIVTIHGIEYEWLPAYENALQRWYLPLSTQYAVLSAHKIIAVSEFTKRQLVERLGAEERKIEVVYEGVETNFQFSITNFQSILKKFKLQSKKYLLFVGTIQPRKNLERLIEAFSVLSTQCSVLNLKLAIAGKWGWNYDGVKQAPVKFGVEDQVEFTGFVDEQEKKILLQNCLVYVQPSITEGFGLPVLEAFAAGVPVVSSSGGALGEITADSGQLFDPESAVDMAEKLKAVVRNGKLRRELVRKGRERIKKFSWSMAAEKTLKIIDGL